MLKRCKKCQIEKLQDKFYKHSQMTSGYLNTCIECYKKENRPCNGIHRRICLICSKEFRTNLSEIKAGGGNYCSRKCWYVKNKQIKKERFTNPDWKNNYIILHRPDNLNSDKYGNIPEHRYVMQQHLGRLLNKDEVVHHINGITNDNRLENLMLFPNNGAHTSFHNNKRWKK